MSFSSPSSAPSSSCLEFPVSTQKVSSPVPYLQVYSNLGVILCREHRCCYTLSNYTEHLLRGHGVKGQLRKQIQTWIQSQKISNVVTQPSHGSMPLPDLEILSGWRCNIIGCDKVSQSEQVIQRHASAVHQCKSKQQLRERQAYSAVALQSLFAKSKEYFIVDPTLALRAPATPLRASIPTSEPLTISSATRFESVRSDLSERFRASQEARKNKYKSITEPQHTSELSPWLRLAKYHEHLSGIDLELLTSICTVPRNEEDDWFLYHVCASVERIFQSLVLSLTDLHHLNTRRLNTFQVGTLSQDPIERLQEQDSVSYYILTFKKLVCYFSRTINGHLRETPFQISPGQQDAYDSLQPVIEAHTTWLSITSSLTSSSSEDNSSRAKDQALDHRNRRGHHDWEAELQRRQEVVDQHVRTLCIALVQQRTSDKDHWSVILSYCAVAAWNVPTQTWRTEDQCGSMLSQLIYDCQLVILASAYELVRRDEYQELSDALKDLCSKWILNDTRSPVSDMSRLRLYAMHVSRHTVNPAQIRWHRDGKTLNYADITYSISFLTQEIEFYFDHAQRIFRQDLCFGLEDIPSYSLVDLRDSWDARKPGLSFIDDPRNAPILEGGSEWLWQQIQNQPHLRSLVLQQSHHQTSTSSRTNVTTDWHIRSKFAQQYEVSVQRFLEYMLVLVHKGSGQPARRKEFLGMRWQNVGFTKRDIFLHDGYMLFLLTYHKSLSRTHASRHPVRFLLPTVGALLVQFLILIQPLRVHFHHEVRIPSGVSEYLWSNGADIWPEEKMTRIMSTMSTQAVGERVNSRAWRQLAAGIAIKKFSGLSYQADLDLSTDPADGESGQSILDSIGGPMADVFHLQAAHNVSTGNRAYGGTLNFNAGLTDAGLQEYFRASRMWHQLCQPSPPKEDNSNNRRRPASTSLNPSLFKRVTLSQSPRRHRRQWGSESVLYILQQLFPRQQPAKFKTEKQAQLVNSVVSGHAEVIGILGTGEGKSLAFLLPPFLPSAGTTVVVVPLVALKSDLIRRCREDNINVSVWKREVDAQQYIGCPLLFVSVEETTSHYFRKFLGQLDANESLDRIVFDESHLILTASSYRPKMALIKELRAYRCQIVFLTATLPPLMQKQFERRLLLSQPLVVRSQTFRNDLHYCIQRKSQPGDFLDYMERGIQTTLKHLQAEAGARVIVYARTRGEVDELSLRISCPSYYSDSGSVEEKEIAAQQWREGKSRVIAATGAFGMGVDYAHVRAVIHMGPPHDMVSFGQEVGRLGRDGRGGTSRVILPYGWQPPLLASAVDEEFTDLPERGMQLYLGRCRCLRAVLSRFQDGHEWMRYCSGDDPNQWCTLCQQAHNIVSPDHPDWTIYWDSPEVVKPDNVNHENDSNTGSESPTIWPGQLQLRLHRRDEEVGRDRYLQRLRAISGRCMICSLLGRVGGGNEHHSLKDCRNGRKWDFFRAKEAAIGQEKPQGGWMKDFLACFRCGNPQEVCSPSAKVLCEYPDIVLPTAWALFSMRNRWGMTLAEVSRAAPEVCESEVRWMNWLGSECELYGQRVCQAARITDWVMGQMLHEDEIG